MAKHSEQEIINAGIALMRTNGYHGTGVQHVLKECGIPKGSFYNFFDSKEEFALKAIDKYAQDNIRTVDEIVHNEGLSSVAKLKRFFNDLIKYYTSKDFEQACLMSILSYEVGDSHPAIAQKIKENFSIIKDLIAQVIDVGQKKGELRSDISATQLADYLINGFNGALITMKYERSDQVLRDFVETSMTFIKRKTRDRTH